MQEDIMAEGWVNYGRWIQPPLSGTFWCSWNRAESLKDLLGDHPLHQLLFLHGHSLNTSEDEAYLRSLLSGMSGSDSVFFFRMRFEHVADRYKQAHLALLYSDYESDRDYIRQLFRTYQDVAGLWWFSVFFGDLLQEHILKEEFVQSEEELLRKLQDATRLERTWLEMQNDEGRSLAAFREAYTEPSPSGYQEAVLSHISRFDWFGTHHWMGDGYSEAQFLEQKGEKIPSVSEEMIKLMGSIMFWRTHFAEVTAKVVFRSRPCLKTYATSRGIDYDTLLYFSHHEIMASFSDDSAAEALRDDSVVRRREQGYGCFLDEHGAEHIVTGHELRSMMDSLVAADTEGEMPEGVVVSRGVTVHGTVKVLLAPQDFEKFESGDVLVASETTPDFVPFMKQASAVITDRGGVTSHAAIVSRELGIPCITGTKRATSLLSDGMEVEVDTENNRIRILRK